jgi:hypothetical protein
MSVVDCMYEWILSIKLSMLVYHDDWYELFYCVGDQTNDDRKLRKLAESLLNRYHEYVTCGLYTNDLIEKNVDWIDIQLKHKYYWCVEMINAEFDI